METNSHGSYDACVSSLIRETYAVVDDAVRTRSGERERQAVAYLEWAIATRKAFSPDQTVPVAAVFPTPPPNTNPVLRRSRVGQVRCSSFKDAIGKKIEPLQEGQGSKQNCRKEVFAEKHGSRSSHTPSRRKRQSRFLSDNEESEDETGDSSAGSRDQSEPRLETESGSDGECSVTNALRRSWAARYLPVAANLAPTTISAEQMMNGNKTSLETAGDAEGSTASKAPSVTVDRVSDPREETGVGAASATRTPASICIGQPLQWLAHRRQLPGLSVASTVHSPENLSEGVTASKNADWLLASFYDHGTRGVAGRHSNSSRG
jgi:hypothetical protein